jgi:heme exporter protein D
MEGHLGGAEMNYDSFIWLPLAAGLTLLGLVLSYLTYKRRGLRPALLGVSFSLLPIAAYLTGAIEMFWKVGVAIGQFATGFVFSPEKWAGIGVTGLAVALFLAAGGRQRRKAAREGRRAARAERAGERTAADGRADRAGLGAPDPTRSLVTRADRPGKAPVPAKPARRAAPPADDDDMKDIEDILRKRGL